MKWLSHSQLLGSWGVSLTCFFPSFFIIFFYYYFGGTQKIQDGPSHSPWAGLALCLFGTKMEEQTFKRAFLFFLSLLRSNFISCKCNMAACPKPSGSSSQAPPASQPTLDPQGWQRTKMWLLTSWSSQHPWEDTHSIDHYNTIETSRGRRLHLAGGGK